MFQHQNDFNNKHDANNAIYLSLYMNTILNIICVVLVYFRYSHYFTLYKSAKYIYIDCSFISSGLLKYLIIELFLILLHPNILFKDMSFTLSKDLNLTESKYFINDILLAISMLRIYLIFQSLIATSDFYSGRADRITKMMSINLDLFFGFKCLINKHHFKAVLFCTVILSIVCAIIMQTLDGVVFTRQSNSIIDYIWTSFVIFTTVGYGDNIALTNIGRFGMVVTALLGIILVSVLIMSLQKIIQLDSHQLKAFDFTNRVKDKDALKELSEDYIGKVILFIAYKNRYTKGINSNSKDLEKIVENVKEALVNRLKAKESLKKRILNYHNTYEPYEHGTNINKRVKELYMKMGEFKKTENSILSNLNKLTKLISIKENLVLPKKLSNHDLNE